MILYGIVLEFFEYFAFIINYHFQALPPFFQKQVIYLERD
jgi:hypothetical protein